MTAVADALRAWATAVTTERDHLREQVASLTAERDRLREEATRYPVPAFVDDLHDHVTEALRPYLREVGEEGDESWLVADGSAGDLADVALTALISAARLPGVADQLVMFEYNLAREQVARFAEKQLSLQAQVVAANARLVEEQKAHAATRAELDEAEREHEATLVELHGRVDRAREEERLAIADRDAARIAADRSWQRLADARTVTKRLTAALIANASLLDVPFGNQPALSPWSRSIKPAIDNLRIALGGVEGE